MLSHPQMQTSYVMDHVMMARPAGDSLLSEHLFVNGLSGLD